MREARWTHRLEDYVNQVENENEVLIEKLRVINSVKGVVKMPGKV